MTRPAIRKLDRPPSLYHSAQESIRDYIRENRLKSGDSLPPETELARQMGISRNSVREAVKALESIGVIEARRGAGIFVGTFSFLTLLENLPYGLMDDLRQVRELLEIRLVLESGMIDRVVEAATPDQIAELQDVLARMKRQASKGESLSAEDREFHRVLFAGIDNGMMLKLLDVFWLAYRKASESIDLRNDDPMQTYFDHELIVKAVQSGDVAGARNAMTHNHYAGLLRRLDIAERRLLALPQRETGEAAALNLLGESNAE